MYQPPAFRQDDPAILHDAIARAGLATLVTFGADGLEATHLPLLLSPDEGPHGTLHGHIAKANQQWRRFDASVPALAIFTGPDAYISPSFYPSKAEHGRVVPTWNYVAIHAYGRLVVTEDADELRALVTRLTERHEKTRAKPWGVTDAPEDFVRAQLRGIVGLTLRIDRIEGKWKMSQNRPEADRAGVANGVADTDIAALIPR